MRLKPMIMTLLSGFFVNNSSAEISGNLSLTSDYDYRGFAQSATDPALQAGLDYAHEDGFYASAWGSTLDWGNVSDADLEIDLIVGFSRVITGTEFVWDVGYIDYLYPGLGEADFGEIYGGISYKDFSAKLSYSNDFAALGQSAWYLEGSYGIDWENGWSALVYGGYSFGDAFSYGQGLAFGSPDYFNYGLGVGYSYKQLNFETKIVGTDLRGDAAINNGVFANDMRVAFTVSVLIP